MFSDLQLVYMGPRNSTQLLKINTTKFQVERDSARASLDAKQLKDDMLRSAHDLDTACLLTLLDWRQCGNSLALCYFAAVMELPDSLWMNCKSEFSVIFLRCSPT